MTAETVLVDGQEHKIEVRPITVVAHPSEVSVEFKDRMTLGPQETVYHGENVKKIHVESPHWIDVIFNSKVPPKNTIEYKHVLGLVDLSLKFKDMGVPFGWKYPESYLHPACQVHLADFAIHLAKGVSQNDRLPVLDIKGDECTYRGLPG